MTGPVPPKFVAAAYIWAYGPGPHNVLGVLLGYSILHGALGAAAPAAAAAAAAQGPEGGDAGDQHP